MRSHCRTDSLSGGGRSIVGDGAGTVTAGLFDADVGGRLPPSEEILVLGSLLLYPSSPGVASRSVPFLRALALYPCSCLPGDAYGVCYLCSCLRPKKEKRVTAKAAKVDPRLKALGLNPRMIDVLALLLRGYSNKVIARYLGISPHAVTDHVSTILERLEVSSRSQVPLRVQPLHQGLLDWDDARRHAPASNTLFDT